MGPGKAVVARREWGKHRRRRGGTQGERFRTCQRTKLPTDCLGNGLLSHETQRRQDIKSKEEVQLLGDNGRSRGKRRGDDPNKSN